MTARTLAPLDRSPSPRAADLEALRRRAVSLGRTFDRVRPLVHRGRTLAINARLVSGRIGEAGAPFTVVAQALGNLTRDLEALVAEVEGAFDEIAAAIAHYTSGEQVLDLLTRAIVEMDTGAVCVLPAGVASMIEPAVEDDWQRAARLAPAHLAPHWRAAVAERAALLAELGRLVATTHRLSSLVERVERMGASHAFFLGTNAVAEAARLERSQSTIAAVAAQIKAFTTDMARALEAASEQAGDLVRGASRATAGLALRTITATEGVM